MSSSSRHTRLSKSNASQMACPTSEPPKYVPPTRFINACVPATRSPAQSASLATSSAACCARVASVSQRSSCSKAFASSMGKVGDQSRITACRSRFNSFGLVVWVMRPCATFWPVGHTIVRMAALAVSEMIVPSTVASNLFHASVTPQVGAPGLTPVERGLSSTGLQGGAACTAGAETGGAHS